MHSYKLQALLIMMFAVCQDSEELIDARSTNYKVKPTRLQATIMLNSALSAETPVPRDSDVVLTFTGLSTKARFTELSFWSRNVARVTVRFTDDLLQEQPDSKVHITLIVVVWSMAWGLYRRCMNRTFVFEIISS